VKKTDPAGIFMSSGFFFVGRVETGIDLVEMRSGEIKPGSLHFAARAKKTSARKSGLLRSG
jgi:hypothetical protein